MDIQQQQFETLHLPVDTTFHADFQSQNPKQNEEIEQQHNQITPFQTQNTPIQEQINIGEHQKQTQHAQCFEDGEVISMKVPENVQNKPQNHQQLQSTASDLYLQAVHSDIHISQDGKAPIEIEVNQQRKQQNITSKSLEIPEESLENKLDQERRSQTAMGFDFMSQKESEILERNGGIQLELIQELQQRNNQELRIGLNSFFPNSAKQFDKLTFKKIRAFIKTLSQNYKKQQFQEVISLNYPPRQQMLSICVRLLPELQDEIQLANNEQLQQIFQQAMDEMKKQNNCKLYKFEYLQTNPFEVKTLIKKPVQILLSQEDIALLIDTALQTLEREQQNQILFREESIRDSHVTAHTMTEQTGLQDQLINQGSSRGSLFSQDPRTQPDSLFSQDRADSVMQVQQVTIIETDVQQHKQPIIQQISSSQVQNKQQEKQTNVQQQSSRRIQQFKVLVQDSQSEEIKKSEKQILSVEKKVIKISEKTENQQKIEKPGKRSFEQMRSSNSEKNDQKDTCYSNGRKSKFNIPDLRQKLIQKLPELKSSIMLLNDEEIEKIFLQSIESSKVPYLQEKPYETRSTMSNKDTLKKGVNNKIQQPKPEIIVSNTPRPQTNEVSGPTKRELLKIKTKNGNTQIVQFGASSAEKKAKKTRTIMLVHTQQEPIEQSTSKLKITQNGEIKHSESIPSALKQFLKMLVNE